MSTTKGRCQTQGCENMATTKARTLYDHGPRFFDVDFVVCEDCAKEIEAHTWSSRIEWPDLAAANATVVGPWVESAINK